GPTMGRRAEPRGASDRGVVIYGQRLREQIEVVRQGGEPMCLIRDPAQNQFIELPELVSEADTEDLGARLSTTLSRRTMAEFVDERHEIFEVPFGTARWHEAERPR